MSNLKSSITDLFQQADNLSRHGQRKEALEIYQSIIAQPGLKKADSLAFELAHWGLAELSILERDSVEAEKHLLIAIELNPKEANYYQQLGSLYAYLDRFEEAIVQLRKSLNVRPNHPQTMHQLGWAIFMSGDQKTGKKILEDALALDDYDASIHNDLAVCLAEMKQYDAAIRQLDRALELDPNNQLLSSYRQMIIEKKASQ
jgi:Flp pilus assembly protein TadD